MRRSMPEPVTTETALRWMLQHKMVLRSSAKDPETFASVRGFILSDEVRERVGANLLKLFAKATSGKKASLGKVTLRDAFLGAAIGAILEVGRVRLDDGPMMKCATIVMALLPTDRLEEAGIAGRRLSSLARDKSLVRKIQQISIGLRA